MHDRVRIRGLFKAGMSPGEIALHIGCSRSSVYRALDDGARLSYSRPTLYDRFGYRVDELLALYPQMDCVALKYQSQWPGSLRQLEREVAKRRSASAESSVIRLRQKWSLSDGENSRDP